MPFSLTSQRLLAFGFGASEALPGPQARTDTRYTIFTLSTDPPRMCITARPCVALTSVVVHISVNSWIRDPLTLWPALKFILDLSRLTAGRCDGLMDGSIDAIDDGHVRGSLRSGFGGDDEEGEEEDATNKKGLFSRPYLRNVAFSLLPHSIKDVNLFHRRGKERFSPSSDPKAKRCNED